MGWAKGRLGTLVSIEVYLGIEATLPEEWSSEVIPASELSPMKTIITANGRCKLHRSPCRGEDEADCMNNSFEAHFPG